MAVKKETQTYLQIANSIKRGVFAPIYVLMGEEMFYIDKLQQMIVERALSEDERDFNLTVFYGTDCDMHDVVNTCRRYPAMSQYQVVVVKEAQNASNLDLLKHYAQKPLASTILVVCNKGGAIKAPELMAALKAGSVGVVFESKKLQEGDVASVIKNYVQERGCRIDEKSVSMMKDFVGTDVSRLVGELDKLVLLVGEGGSIVPEVIERNIGISKDFNNFELGEFDTKSKGINSRQNEYELLRELMYKIFYL